MKQPPLLAVSIGGVFSDDIHPMVEDLVRKSVSTARFLRLKGEPVTFSGDVDRAVDAIEAQPLCERLIVVGKSAGGILAWYLAHEERLIRRYPNPIFVLIDPHGAVNGDRKFGPYCERQDLCSEFIPDGPVLCNVYQHNHAFMGASFPDLGNRNIRIGDPWVDHRNITQHKATREVVRWAIKEANKED